MADDGGEVVGPLSERGLDGFLRLAVEPGSEGFGHDFEELLGGDVRAGGDVLGFFEIQELAFLELPVLEILLGFDAVVPAGDVNRVCLADVFDAAAVALAENEFVVADFLGEPCAAEGLARRVVFVVGFGAAVVWGRGII
ncbi:MAG: hypothetical protein KGR46_07335 [Verrucomicrobia bacterium]|nr:hypothetical protein [Verrucomicrobiota bacterium]